MPANYDLDADRFAFVFGQMVEDVAGGIEEALLPAVRSGCRKAAEVTKSREGGRTKWSARYREGFKYRVSGSGMEAEGYVGNKNKPGLVHLLEKGHANVDGGKTQGYEHLSTGYTAGAEAFEKALDKGVDRALRS